MRAENTVWIHFEHDEEPGSLVFLSGWRLRQQCVFYWSVGLHHLTVCRGEERSGMERRERRARGTEERKGEERKGRGEREEREIERVGREGAGEARQ